MPTTHQQQHNPGTSSQLLPAEGQAPVKDIPQPVAFSENLDDHSESLGIVPPESPTNVPSPGAGEQGTSTIPLSRPSAYLRSCCPLCFGGDRPVLSSSL